MNQQEQYWSGKEGNAYNERNKPDDERSIKFIERVLSKKWWGGSRCDWIRPSSAIEFGANDGRNLKALKTLGVAHVTGVEINKESYEKIKADKVIDEVYLCSMLDLVFHPNLKWELSFTKGCLIHINPINISKAYDVLYESSSKYILIAEYYSPFFEDILYQGNNITTRS